MVLAVVAAMMAGVASLLAGLPAIRLRAAADDLADTMRGLRDQAVRRGGTVELTLDPARRTFATSLDRTPRSLPDVVERVDVQVQTPLRADAMPRFQFFPDGSAVGGTVLLRRGNRIEVVVVDWLTGRVRRDG